MEKWFAFRAYNSQEMYGFGTADEAERYADEVLNKRKEINLYAPSEVSDEEAAEKGLEDSGFNIADALAEIED